MKTNFFRLFIQALLILLVAQLSIHPITAQGVNIALNKSAVALTTQSGLPASATVDGNAGTRWSSEWSDPQWLQIDLGATYTINRVILRWEAAYGRSYQIQVSPNGTTWTTIYSTTTGDGGTDDLTGLSGSGQYIRFYGTARGTGWGYSLWEFEVYSATAPTNTRTPTRTSTAPPSGCGTTNIALNRQAEATSSETPGMTPNFAVDGNAGTRWSSAFSDPQWIRIDLGSVQTICRVRLNWEGAYGRSYQIQVSNDTINWTTIYSTTTGDGGIDDLTGLSGSGRYLRMNGTVRSTPYGYSLWEFEVFGGSLPTQQPTFQPPTNTATVTRTSTGCPNTNIAYNRDAAASSTIGGTTAKMAVDGTSGTRWESQWSDPQWLRIDFGSTATFCRVRLNWETAAASAYQIQTSGDAINWTTIYSTTTSVGGIQDLQVSGSGRYIRMNGTARTTVYGYSLWEFEVYGTGGTPLPTLTPTPTINATFWGDTSSIPPAQNVLMFKFLNRTNGRYPDSQIYWSFNGQTYSIAERPYFDMPANSAGRMYFYLGAPNSEYNDFIEFTIGPDIFNGNTTRVDAFGLKLAMRLRAHDGYDAAVGEDLITFQEDRAVTFQKFINEVPAEFKHLAQVQAPYRILAPGRMGETKFLPSGEYANYFTSYATSVGVNASVFDIFACAGYLADKPGLCAALNRHVAHLPQSQWGDASLYYQAAPANYFSKFWHDHSLGGLAYGFAYDDYADQSSFITHGDPQWLLVAIGW
jgi:hypothetical protein